MIFRDLILQVDPEQADAFINELAGGLPSGWRRRADQDDLFTTPWSRAFVYERQSKSCSERLILYQKEGTEGKFEVGNIGSSAGNLEPAEYNAIVEEFAEIVAEIFGDRVMATLGPAHRGSLAERLGVEPAS